jgi:hypothetical protein
VLKTRSVLKPSVFVTTGGLEGIRMQQIPIAERAQVHYERLRRSEFGLLCLWSMVDDSLLEVYAVLQVSLCCVGDSTVPSRLILMGSIQAFWRG